MRYSRKQAEQAAQRLARAAGMELRNGYRLPDWEGVSEQDMDKTPYWLLDYNSIYGGFVIDEVTPEWSLTGHGQPFGPRRRTATEFVEWTWAVIAGIELGIKKANLEAVEAVR